MVVGLPVHNDGREGEKARAARGFGGLLSAWTGIPVLYHDERFTTVEAERILRDKGLSPAKRKAQRDRLAAQILLQGYLDAGCPAEIAPSSLDGN
jgi:putative Holliday junction resolvase